MLIEISTMKNENIISHNDEIFPFVVSLSNHERAVHPSTGSGRTVKSLFSKQYKESDCCPFRLLAHLLCSSSFRRIQSVPQ
jgi:hypothetical protein